MFAKQLIERGCIYDYAAANDLWRQICAETDPRWEFFPEKYGAIRKELSVSFAALKPLSRFYSRYDTKVNLLSRLRIALRFSGSPDAQNIPHNTTPENDSASSLESVRFVREKGLNKLQEDHKVSVMRHTSYPQLIFLVSHVCGSLLPFLSPTDGFPLQHFGWPKSVIEKECYNGILLDQSKNYSLVSYSFPYIGHFGERQEIPDSTGLDHWRVEEKVDGTYCCLYYYIDKWYIATRYEPNEPRMTLSFLPIMEVAKDCTVDDHFWKTWGAKGMKLPDPSLNRSGFLRPGCNRKPV